MGARQITTAVTMLVLCVILVLGVVIGYKTLFSPLPNDSGTASASPSPTCTTQDVRRGQRLHAREVQVSVFNAGTRAGLADETLNRLGNRGFKEGEASNAPASAKVRFVQVWTTKKHDAAAALVAQQFGSNTLVRVTNKDLGPGVDVLVGTDFRGLKKAKRSLLVRQKQQLCDSASG
jgi:hypothetical protein